MRTLRALTLVVAAFSASYVEAARAQESPAATDSALAETLFQEGKSLLAAKRYEEACAKLAESQRLDAATGTLLALAACHEALGKTATAWAEFTEAAAVARSEGRRDRIDFAEARIRALEPSLSRLAIHVGGEAAATPGLAIRRDGVPIGRAAWEVAVPVDPGEHTIEATGPGKKPWRKIVTVGASGDEQSVAIPPLEGDSRASVPETRIVPERERPIQSDGGQRTIGFVVGGIGLAALGVGSVFGVRAIVKSSDVRDVCSPSHCTNRDAVDDNHDAKLSANVANVGIGVGVVAIVVGTVLVLTAPRAKKDHARRAGALADRW